MAKNAIVTGLLNRGYISSAECKATVFDFLNTYKINQTKISDWYDAQAILPKLMRDIKKNCNPIQIGEGKGKIYLYKRDEVLDYLRSLKW